MIHVSHECSMTDLKVRKQCWYTLRNFSNIVMHPLLPLTLEPYLKKNLRYPYLGVFNTLTVHIVEGALFITVSCLHL